MRRNPNTGQYTPDPGGLLLKRQRKHREQKTGIGFFGILWNALILVLILFALASILGK
jgi:hypothetical protein